MEGTARQIADRLRHARAVEWRAQAEQLACVGELIDAYDTIPTLDVPGAERLIPAGADGTPLVAEFLAAELGPLLGESIASAWNLIHDVANLRSRHPLLWDAVQARTLPAWQARRIAQACADAELGLDAARWVDEQLRPALGTVCWQRLRKELRGLVVGADQALAALRAEKRKRERFVSIRHDDDGSSFLTARLDTADAVRLGESISTLARGLVTAGRTETLPELRAEALGLLARPDGDATTLPRPRATLVVHIAREAVYQCGGVARVEGVGPLLLAQVKDLLAHHRVRVLPVLDLAGDPSVDGYEIPAWMRTQVTIRDPYSVFPYSNMSSAACDLDHTREYDHDSGPPDQTRPSNLGPFGRREHRPKTFTGLRVEQPTPGVFHWTTALGYRYRVDATGTHALDPPLDPIEIPDPSLAETSLLNTIIDYGWNPERKAS